VPAFCLFLALVAAACNEAPPAASAARREAPAAQSPEWEHIRTWSGRGSQYLDSFPSEGALRVEWETKREPGAKTPGSFEVVFHSAISGRPLAGPTVDHTGEGKGVAFFSEEPRVFFVSVTSEDLEWKISVSERVR
jgi:hypothetical protein